uniref:Uncharacterized protein n=1 Tax=Triticum urartu TaxID=4572 RepID=A0A8R7UW72_TRIUA
MPGLPHVCHVAADDRNGGKAGRLNSSTATSPPCQQQLPSIAGGHGTRRRKPAAMTGATRERP